MTDNNLLFPGMTDEEIEELMLLSQPSEEHLEEFRQIIEADKTPEGRKRNEELKKKYPVESIL